MSEKEIRRLGREACTLFSLIRTWKGIRTEHEAQATVKWTQAHPSICEVIRGCLQMFKVYRSQVIAGEKANKERILRKEI